MMAASTGLAVGGLFYLESNAKFLSLINPANLNFFGLDAFGRRREEDCKKSFYDTMRKILGNLKKESESDFKNREVLKLLEVLVEDCKKDKISRNTKLKIIDAYINSHIETRSSSSPEELEEKHESNLEDDEYRKLCFKQMFLGKYIYDSLDSCMSEPERIPDSAVES